MSRYPLHKASRQGLLQDPGNDINSRDSMGKTPLFHAIFYNQLDSARFLLDNGAKIDPDDIFVVSSAEMARLLRQYGADFTSLGKFNGWSLLSKACFFGFYGLIEYLLLEARIPILTNKDGTTPLDVLEKTAWQQGIDNRESIRELFERRASN